MRMYDIIRKKRDGGTLTTEEIRYFIEEYTAGRIPDYQASALLMAIFIRGMDLRETTDLTIAMAKSGDVIDLSGVKGETADKHSTGGVGDKTTLICVPMAAALGCKIAKMSGRGLGHTGGTIDKLESIPGFKTELPPELFLNQVNSIGLSVVGQSGQLTPADKKLYALRNLTGTIENQSLIASSIISKKLAGGSKNIVLDVKYGSGAFMKTPKDAVSLAEEMCQIGNKAGRKMTALISNMDTPLGYNIGNNLEVIEAIEVLNNRGSADLREICVTLAGLMYASCFDKPFDESKIAAEKVLEDGSALDKLRQMVHAQLGDVSLIDHPDNFEKSRITHEVRAQKDGYISKMDSEKIGTASVILGAGREAKDEPIDYPAGIVLCKKTGDHVSVGDPIAVLHTNREKKLHEAEQEFISAIDIEDRKPAPEPLIYKIIR